MKQLYYVKMKEIPAGNAGAQEYECCFRYYFTPTVSAGITKALTK